MSVLDRDHDLLTAREAADFLRASRPKFYRLLKTGELKGYKVGAHWVFFKRDLLAFVRRCPTTGPSLVVSSPPDVEASRTAVKAPTQEGSEGAVAGKEQRPKLAKAQLTIAAMVAMGQTNQEIADKLGIVEQTVKNQLYHCFRLCGVRSRTDFVAALFGGRLPLDIERMVHEEMHTKAPDQAQSKRSHRQTTGEAERATLNEHQKASQVRAS